MEWNKKAGGLVNIILGCMLGLYTSIYTNSRPYNRSCSL